MGTNAVQIEPGTLQLFAWVQAQPLVQALVITMALDILSGLVAAVVTKTVCSTASWAGMSRKALVWLVIGAAAAIDQLTPEIPETKIVCGFYVITESLSILENAGRAGVPLPKFIYDSLKKLRPELAAPQVPNVNVKEVAFLNVQNVGAATSGDPIAGPRGKDGPVS